MKRSLSLLLAVVLAGASTTALTAPAAFAADTNGQFSVLTYNVAGLPEPLSSGNPAKNTPIIGSRIGAYAVVNVQEDFNYHAALYAADNHPHRTPTSGGVPFGDGLNTLSTYPYTDFARVKWNQCNGTDCLTPKGFTFSRIRLVEGVYVDLYNVHANAGSADADLAARRANITQLSQYVAQNSAGNAVIVMGDTNTRYTRTGDNIRDLVRTNGLTDAWIEKIRGGVEPTAGDPALVCDPANVTQTCEVVDKIFYRDNAFIDLTATGYRNDHAAFLDAEGQPLSDHYPHTVGFSWKLADHLRMSDQVGGPHGTPFTDVAALQPGTAVRTVTLKGASRLDGVGIALTNGAVLEHGGTGGTATSLTLQAGEYLTAATLTQGQRDGRTRIFSVRITTNLGRTVSTGTPTSDSVTYTAPTGWQIAGFTGRSGSEIDKLGLIYVRR
ncbi:endonuclease [Saccharothrix sp. ALI-22-I]|uniref:jacalin-like lectin n=1 Tax=Saccharothrix sp. ALI-22-I TaxID=1933778 RepID=UPI00097C530A|nr:jacalin-like lectin [Saccharothrix sp. ALI-22-I]ONI87118.1 endonuclease [Saccharothrix sp. ALI-22-I]